VIGRYDEEVRLSDRLIGSIAQDLDRLGLGPSTVLVVVGDHGEEFAEHDGFGHGHDVFPEQARVPLVVRWADEPRFRSLPPRVDTPVSTAALFPTLSDYLGLPPPDGADSEGSLRAVLERGEGAAVMTESFQPGRCVAAYRQGAWALRLAITRARSPLETAEVQVFDARSPSGEVAPESETLRSLTAEARGALQQRWLEWKDKGPAESRKAAPADEAVERLRSLGYVR
jgi:arylsulfatase A-like enzyme